MIFVLGCELSCCYILLKILKLFCWLLFIENKGFLKIENLYVNYMLVNVVFLIKLMVYKVL